MVTEGTMKDNVIVKIVALVGWILVGLGALFTIWLFIRVFSDGAMKEPLMTLFFLLLIFCSIAVGMFFVVLSIIVKILKNIETNVAKP